MLQIYVSHPAFYADLKSTETTDGKLIQTRGAYQSCSSGDGLASTSHDNGVPQDPAYLRLSLRRPQKHGVLPAQTVTAKAYKM